MNRLVEISRKNTGCSPQPTYAIIDSQSVKTTSASDERVIDGGKKIKGRKRHIVVDTQKHLPGVTVHAANMHDTVSGIFPALYATNLYPSIKGLCGDSGYRGTFVEEIKDLCGLSVDIVQRKEKTSWRRCFPNDG